MKARGNAIWIHSLHPLKGTQMVATTKFLLASSCLRDLVLLPSIQRIKISCSFVVEFGMIGFSCALQLNESTKEEHTRLLTKGIHPTSPMISKLLPFYKFTRLLQ